MENVFHASPISKEPSRALPVRLFNSFFSRKLTDRDENYAWNALLEDGVRDIVRRAALSDSPRSMDVHEFAQLARIWMRLQIAVQLQGS